MRWPLFCVVEHTRIGDVVIANGKHRRMTELCHSLHDCGDFEVQHVGWPVGTILPPTPRWC